MSLKNINIKATLHYFFFISFIIIFKVLQSILDFKLSEFAPTVICLFSRQIPHVILCIIISNNNKTLSMPR